MPLWTSKTSDTAWLIKAGMKLFLTALKNSLFSPSLHHPPSLLISFSFFTSSPHRSFTETLLILLSFIICHPSWFLGAFLLIPPSHLALLEASKWTPLRCITWKSNWTLFVSINTRRVAGCGQLSGSDIINREARWQKSVLVHNVHTHTCTRTRTEECGR